MAFCKTGSPILQERIQFRSTPFGNVKAAASKQAIQKATLYFYLHLLNYATVWAERTVVECETVGASRER